MQHSSAISPGSDHDGFWAQSLTQQPFYVDGLTFEDYAPAFRLGNTRWRDDTLIDDVLARLGEEWDAVKGDSRLTWFEARPAVRAAWERHERLMQRQSVEA